MNTIGDKLSLIQDHGTRVTLASIDMSRRRDKTPIGLYRNPELNEGNGFVSMDKVDGMFKLPDRIYGKAASYCDLIMQDYDPEGELVGVLLLGKKGMGKSMLAEMLATRIYVMGYPVIHVTKRINPATLPRLLELVGPCVLYLEEFEKCFDQPEDVPIILNMLSDSTLKGCMVIISANTLDVHRYDPLLDRPQRLKYRINYGKLDKQTIDQILGDHEVTDEQKNIYLEWALSSNPNIDSLITLVKMTGHITDGCALVDFISILNVPNLNQPRYEAKEVRILDWSFKVIKDVPYTFEVKTIDGKNSISIEIKGMGFNKQMDVPFGPIEEDRTGLDLNSKVVHIGDEQIGTITVEVTPGITRLAGEKLIKCKVALNTESINMEPLVIIDEYQRAKVFTSGLEWWE